MSSKGRGQAVARSAKDNWDKLASIFSLRVASSTFQTTDVNLMGLNWFGSVVRGGFATGVTMPQYQSSGISDAERESLIMGERTGDTYRLNVLRTLAKSAPGPVPLLRLRARWDSDSVMRGLTIRGWTVGVDTISAR